MRFRFFSLAAIVIAVVCWQVLERNSSQPSASVGESATAKNTSRHRSSASSNVPTGNQQTRDFLAWGRNLFEFYCNADLDSAGNCVGLDIYVCWESDDEELLKISELKHLKSLSIRGPAITDRGLNYLESLPALTTLEIVMGKAITDEGLRRLRQVNPRLQIELPMRYGVSEQPDLPYADEDSDASVESD